MENGYILRCSWRGEMRENNMAEMGTGMGLGVSGEAEGAGSAKLD